jgi:hypothetical protein
MESQAPLSFFLTLIFLVLSIVLTIISRMMIFEKAGRSNVSAFIPFLNFYVMLQITGMKRISTFLYAMTLLNIYLSIQSLMPLLMPDEVAVSRFSLLAFIMPFFHAHAINALFVIYWLFNTLYLIVYTRMHIRLAALFGKPTGFGLGMAFLEPVFYPVLAFGKASLKKEYPV